MRILKAPHKDIEREDFMGTSNAKRTREIILVLISFLLMFGFGPVVGPFAEVTQTGVNVLGVFLGVILMTIFTSQTFLACVLGMAALIFGGYVTAANAIATWLGGGTVPQFIFISALCLALKGSGAMDIIVKKFISIRFLQGKPKLFLFSFFAIAYVVSMFITFVPMCILAFSMFDSIREVVGYDKHARTSKFILLGAYFGCMGSYALPFRGVQLVVIGIANTQMQTYGLSFSNLTWWLLQVIVNLVWLLAYVHLLPLLKCDLVPLKNLDVKNVEALQRIPDRMDRRQVITLAGFILAIAYLLSINLLPTTLPWYDTYAFLGGSFGFLLMLAVLNFIHVDGKPVVNAGEELKNGAMWGIVVIIGCFSLLGNAMADAELGIRAWIISSLSPVFGGMGLLPLLILIAVIITFATNFCNGLPLVLACNSAVLPFICELELSTGISSSAVATMINLCANMAFLTYAGTIYSSLILGREEIDQKWVWGDAIKILPAFMAVCFVVCYALCHILP